MQNILHTPLSGLCSDSRQVQPGDVFMAYPGLTTDGRLYIQDAINKGAIAVLSEYQANAQALPLMQVPIIPYTDLQNTVGYIANQFYDKPSEKMHVMGVTGTNGKTSCTHFIAQIMQHLGKPCGVMGTLGVGLLGELRDLTVNSHKFQMTEKHQQIHHAHNINNIHQNNMTTADAILTHQHLAWAYEHNISSMAIEVTSHALTQGRMNGVHFETAIFTNLTRDHLDYHQTLENYWQAKKRLFLDFNPKNSIVNLDDEHGLSLYKELKEQNKNVIGYTSNTNHASDTNHTTQMSSECMIDTHHCILTQEVLFNEQGIQANIKTPWGVGNFHCHLLGKFNLSNLLAAIGALCLQGFSLNEVLNALPFLHNAPGRMTSLGGNISTKEPKVIIDFAHTPDALMMVLQALKSHCKGKLWCIFGCGGNRDAGKRPLMAEVAETFADWVIVTNDNPREENPDSIIQDILKGFSDKSSITVESDRALAIAYAIYHANPDDLILVAGKGHETYQIIGKEKIPFNDEAVVKEALKELERKQST